MPFFEEAKTKTWMLTEGQWQLEAWLELLPFSDRPCATLEGIELAGLASRHPPRRERIVFALGVAPDPIAEDVLSELADRFPAMANAYDWMKAFVARGTVSGVGRLLDLLQRPDWPTQHDTLGGWTLAEHISGVARANVALQAELSTRYRTATGQYRETLEFVLSEMGNPVATMEMARSYARTRRPFDHRFHHAIRETALTKQPAAGWI